MDKPVKEILDKVSDKALLGGIGTFEELLTKDLEDDFRSAVVDSLKDMNEEKTNRGL